MSDNDRVKEAEVRRQPFSEFSTNPFAKMKRYIKGYDGKQRSPSQVPDRKSICRLCR